MKTNYFPNTVMIDCTASATVASFYQRWIRQGMHIITPNKRANSGPLDYVRNFCNTHPFSRCCEVSQSMVALFAQARVSSSCRKKSGFLSNRRVSFVGSRVCRSDADSMFVCTAIVCDRENRILVKGLREAIVLVGLDPKLRLKERSPDSVGTSANCSA